MVGTPVLRVDRRGQSPLFFNLRKGPPILSIDPQLAKAQAQVFFENSGLSANATFLGKLERDQWTVSGGFNSMRPFYRFAAGNDTGSQIYVSSVNGKLVQPYRKQDGSMTTTITILNPMVGSSLPKSTGTAAGIGGYSRRCTVETFPD